MNLKVIFLTLLYTMFASITLYGMVDDRTTRQIAIDIDTTLTTCCADIAENFMGTFTVIASIIDSQQGGCKTQVITQADVGTTGFTITTSGVYTVVENIIFNPTISSAAITINADKVVLDLQCFSITQGNSTANVDGISINADVNSVAIEGGKLTNFTRDGIRVASGCSLILYSNITIENCLYGIFLLGTNISSVTDIQATGLDLLSNSTGLSLNFVERAIVSTCNFFGNTYAGIELVSSFSNTIESCSIENTNAVAGSAAAISLNNGGNNRVNSCYIDGVSTADTFSDNSAVGILIGATENDDIIINNQISNCTTSSSAQPFGIEMLYTFTAALLTPLNSNQTSSGSGSGAWAPSGRYYLQAAPNQGVALPIYEFKKNTLTLDSNVAPSSPFEFPSWSPDGSFIAAGSNRVVKVDQGLVKTVGTTSSVSSIWSPFGKYIADGNFPQAGSGIYSFDGSVQTLVTSLPGTTSLSAWSPDGNYLATMSFGGSGVLTVFKFVNNSLQQITSVSAVSPSLVPQTCQWSHNGRYLLVASTNLTVYQFTGSSLQVVVSLPGGSVPYYNAEWSPDDQYIAAANVTPALPRTQTLNFFKFTGTSLISVETITNNSSSLVIIINNTLKWSPLGNAIAYTFGVSSFGTSSFLAIYSGQNFPSGTLIQNNEISNVRGPALPAGQLGFSSGRGLSASSATNLIIQNTAFDNDINYVFVNNIFEQFVSNAAQRPSVIANISFPPL